MAAKRNFGLGADFEAHWKMLKAKGKRPKDEVRFKALAVLNVARKFCAGDGDG